MSDFSVWQRSVLPRAFSFVLQLLQSLVTSAAGGGGAVIGPSAPPAQRALLSHCVLLAGAILAWPFEFDCTVVL